MDNGTRILLVIAVVAVAATLAGAIVLLIRLLRTRNALRRAGVPVSNKFAFWGALLYTVSPVDLLPDPVYLDDIGVLLLALHSLRSAAGAASARPGRADAEPEGYVGGPR